MTNLPVSRPRIASRCTSAPRPTAAATPLRFSPLPPSVPRQTKCHTVQSLFAPKSLKTNKSGTNKVTHFFNLARADSARAAGPKPLVVLLRCSIFAPRCGTGGTMRNFATAAGVCAPMLASALGGATSAQASSAARSELPNCDRQCLYGFLDQYLAALKAKDASRLPLARNFRYSENNVMMKFPDGVWGTITGFSDYNLRTADPAEGAVGC